MIVNTSIVQSASDGRHRLVLRHRKLNDRSRVFHDLMLQSQMNGEWSAMRTVWSGKKINNDGRELFVSKLYGLSRDLLSATIQIGATSLTDANGHCVTRYAWVLWGIETNRLLHSIRECSSPFDKLPANNRFAPSLS